MAVSASGVSTIGQTGMRRTGMAWLVGCGLRRALLLCRDRHGVAAVELALVLPILLLLAFGTVEIGRFVLLHMKLEQLSTITADLGTRDRTLEAATVDDILAAAPIIMRPFRLDEDGVVVLSGIGTNGDGQPSVLWQRRGAGDNALSSGTGGVGATVGLPPALTVSDGQTLVMAEVVYRYRPWLFGFIGERTLIKRAYFRPRLGALRELI